jgi:uncharacterized protein YuzE
VKAKYDRETDTLKLILREGVAVSESDEDKPGVILDYDLEGNLISIEVLDVQARGCREQDRAGTDRVAGAARVNMLRNKTVDNTWQRHDNVPF